MKRLKALDVKSVFQVSLILGAVAGVLVGVVLFVADLMDHRVSEAFITLILAPILYGLMGALVNAFMAKIYNIVAQKFGGIGIDLE